jgi:hypothetical protein
MGTSAAAIDKINVSNESESVAWKRWSILILLGLSDEHSSGAAR